MFWNGNDYLKRILPPPNQIPGYATACGRLFVYCGMQVFDHQLFSHYTQSQSTVNRVYDNKARRYTPKTTELNRILRTSKSEAEVTNNKKCARGGATENAGVENAARA